MKTISNLRLSACTVTAAALLAAGCADMSAREQGTVKGAGIGAATGAVVGGITGSSVGTSAVVGAAIGAVAGNVWSKRQEDRRVELEKATQGTGVSVSRTADDQLKLNVPSDVSFATNSYAIRPEMSKVLDPFANSLRGDPNAHVSIVGYTDSTGNDAINKPLSVERAQSVRDYLVARGVAPSQIETSGLGSLNPIADNSTAAGRAQNRRVEIFLRETA